MGKKNKKKGGDEEPETPRDDDDTPDAVAVDVSDEPPAAKPAASSSAEETTPTISDSVQVSGTSETRHIEEVAYCDICSMPFEFCEWQPLSKKCMERFPEVYKEHYPDVNEEGLQELMGKLWINDDKAKRAQKSKGGGAAAAMTAVATPAAEAGEGGEGAAAPPSPMSKKEKKSKEAHEIVIELNNRNKKKHITVIKVCAPSCSPLRLALPFAAARHCSTSHLLAHFCP